MGIRVPIRFQRQRKKYIMKVFVPAILALAAADDKKVPPRHPLQRLKKLTTFAGEWCGDNLTDKQADNWVPKFEANAARMERRFELCGYYDDQSEHGGPRERRSAEEIKRYDQANPMRGIQQITRGFSKWAQRYIADCKVQPAKQVDRMAKWYGQMLGKLQDNMTTEEPATEPPTESPTEPPTEPPTYAPASTYGY